MLLEVCVDSVESAVEAEAGGASRVELCSALVEGGLTPSAGLVRQVVRRVGVPVHVLVRPRAGDFLYSEDETEVMREDVRQACAMGADGVVVGCLRADGTVDEERTRSVIACAPPGTSVTFHRAFDLARDLDEAVEALARLGVDTVLTSGMAATAAEGADAIRAAVRLAAGRFRVMPGGGVRAHNAADLVRATGVRDLHASARGGWRDGGMRFRRPGVFMGGERANTPGVEYRSKAADRVAVQDILRAARSGVDDDDEDER